jgi:hypothetical protein
MCDGYIYEFVEFMGKLGLNLVNAQNGINGLSDNDFNNATREGTNAIMEGQAAYPAPSGNPTYGASNETGARLANFILSRANAFTCTGSSNAYIGTTNADLFLVACKNLYTGLRINLIVNHTNTGASTLNLDGLGVKNIKQINGSELSSGMMLANQEYTLLYNGTYWILINPSTNTSASPQRIILANNVSDPNNDIDFSAGTFWYSDYSGYSIASATTKRLDANWTQGTNQGGLDTGTKQINTKYNCFKIYNPTTSTQDAIFSLGAYNVGPTLPSGYTKFSYIGTVFTDGSGNIRAFTQSGNLIEFATTITEFTSITTSYQDASITIPAAPCIARMSYQTSVGGNDSIHVVVKSNLSGVETNLGSVSYTSQNGGCAFQVSSNNGQIQRKYLQFGNSTPSGFNMYLQGYQLLV